MLPVLDNPDTLFATLRADTARMAKMMKTWSASQERYDAMRNSSRARLVYLNYPPTRTAIAGSGMDSASFDRMTWDAMTADYDRIAAAGQSIKRLLDSGKSVRVTTPDGTDLRFSLTGRSAAMTGATLTAEQRRAKLAAQRSITLPGGRVAVAPLESSGSGKVVVARDECLGATLVNARFEVRAGKLTGCCRHCRTCSSSCRSRRPVSLMSGWTMMVLPRVTAAAGARMPDNLPAITGSQRAVLRATPSGTASTVSDSFVEAARNTHFIIAPSALRCVHLA
jgi:hypothetical protein